MVVCSEVLFCHKFGNPIFTWVEGSAIIGPLQVAVWSCVSCPLPTAHGNPTGFCLLPCYQQAEFLFTCVHSLWRYLQYLPSLSIVTPPGAEQKHMIFTFAFLGSNRPTTAPSSSVFGPRWPWPWPCPSCAPGAICSARRLGETPVSSPGALLSLCTYEFKRKYEPDATGTLTFNSSESWLGKEFGRP